MQDLYDFWYAVIKCHKNGKWLADNVSAYRVVEMTSEIKIIITNSEAEATQVRSQLAELFDDDDFDVWGEGYSMEMCIDNVKENENFLVCHTETTEERVVRHKEELRLEQIAKEQQRRQNLYDYKDSTPLPVPKPNRKLFEKFLSMSEKDVEYCFNKFLQHCLIRLSSMTAITATLLDMRLWFINAVFKYDGSGTKLLMMRGKYESASNDEYNLVVSKEKEKTPDTFYIEHMKKSWLELVKFAPRCTYLEPDQQQFMCSHRFATRLTSYSKGGHKIDSNTKARDVICRQFSAYFERYLSERGGVSCSMCFLTMPLVLLGMTDAGSILCLLDADVVRKIVSDVVVLSAF